MNKEYKIEIDPRILELLGPNLYTNIYYVLAELIANAYDADAHNVYIIADDKSIRVEDDGHGMSYSNGDISRYLGVAKVSRTDESNSYTPEGRRKMGRKGIGKLAALSVSSDVQVMTICNDEKSGFILSRHPGNGGMLQPIADDSIELMKVKGNGTAVIMPNPEYHLHKTPDAVRRNIINIFPLINDNFKIHVELKGHKEFVIERLDDVFAKSLCAIISLGDEYKYLVNKVPNKFPDKRNRLCETRSSYRETLKLKNNSGDVKEYQLEIKGWIGAYESTKGRKKDPNDFPDNFISLYANKKLGEFNILPHVGKNSLNESYIVGQLHVDLFELSELPDMALSNRQGYKSDDLRYIRVISYVRNTLLPEILNKRVTYTNLKNAATKKKQLSILKKKEEDLKRNVKSFKRKTSETISREVSEATNLDTDKIDDIVDRAINDNIPFFGIKKTVDKGKKRILISQTGADKVVSDLIYNFLTFNNVPKSDILYSNCDEEICRIPEGVLIYDYLRDFFVNSYSDEKIYVIFVISEHIKGSFGTMSEIGAAWITRSEHKIIVINNFTPQPPLNVGATWQNTKLNDDGNITMSKLESDNFCSKIEDVSRKLGYIPESRENNIQKLSTLINISD